MRCLNLHPITFKDHNNFKKIIMSSTYTSLYLHAVWGTKHRQPLITPEIEPRIYRFITGIIKNEGGRVFAIDGMPDHVHLFFSIPQTVSIPKLMQAIKAKSSKLVHENFPDNHFFAWQSGYGIFSVSASMGNTVKNYVLSQKEHHQKLSFEEEYLGLLKKHGIVFDPKFVLEPNI